MKCGMTALILQRKLNEKYMKTQNSNKNHTGAYDFQRKMMWTRNKNVHEKCMQRYLQVVAMTISIDADWDWMCE